MLFVRIALLHLVQIWLPVLFAPCYILALAHGTETAVDMPGLLALSCGALFVYSAERYPDTRNPSHPRYHQGMARILLIVSLGSGAALAALLLFHGLHYAVSVAVLAAVALSYMWLRRWVLPKSLSVGFAFAYGMVALGFAEPNPLSWDLKLQLYALQILLLFAVCTVLCDMKDAHNEDLEERLRRPTILLLFASLACALAILRLSMSWSGIAACIAIALLAAVPTTVLRRPLVGPLLIDGALLCTALSFWW